MPCQHMFRWSSLISLRGTLSACTARLPWRCCGLSYSSCTGTGPLVPRHLDGSTKDSATSADEEALHTPVMLKEVLHCLDVQPGQVFLDMTFGGGGHSRAVLEAAAGITVLALDRDSTAISLAQQLAKEYQGRVQPLLGRFSELEALSGLSLRPGSVDAQPSGLSLRPGSVEAQPSSLSLRPGSVDAQPSGLSLRPGSVEAQPSSLSLRPGSVDAVLLDAGCSSMQMDRAERGFSLSKDGPLDMRMDGDRYPDMPLVADVVNALDQQALASVLSAYGEEKHARKIASAIVEARRVYPITRTQQLASVVAGCFPAAALYARKDRLQRPSHVATKTFQALRMFVNDELNELHAGLRVAQTVLRPGGRLCVLTFHSLEDRLVKRFLQGEDLAAPRRRSLSQRIRGGGGGGGGGAGEEEEEEGGDGERASAHWRVQQRVIKPQMEEVIGNPRGRSAKLRAAFRR